MNTAEHHLPTDLPIHISPGTILAVDGARQVRVSCSHAGSVHATLAVTGEYQRERLRHSRRAERREVP